MWSYKFVASAVGHLGVGHSSWWKRKLGSAVTALALLVQLWELSRQGPGARAREQG